MTKQEYREWQHDELMQDMFPGDEPSLLNKIGVAIFLVLVAAIVVGIGIQIYINA